MKLLTYSTSTYTEKRLGVRYDDERIIDLSRAYELLHRAAPPDWFRSVHSLLHGGDPAMDLARRVFNDACADKSMDNSVYRDMGEIVFHPPAGENAKIMCVTMNYASHAVVSGSKPSQQPYYFIKMPTLMTAHGRPICKSKTSEKHDSEIELAVIIGKRGKYIAREDAFDYIAGYSIINDFSFRDRRSISEDPNSARLHWFTLKNLDNAAPIGPWLVTADDIPDPYDLEISLTLDNEPELKQVGSTEGMMHRIEDLVYHASNGLTLEPGDVIATGTPHEIAFGQKRFLRDGDVLRAEISRIGALVNPIKAETA